MTYFLGYKLSKSGQVKIPQLFLEDIERVNKQKNLPTSSK